MTETKTAAVVLLDFEPLLVVWCPGNTPEYPSIQQGVIQGNYGATQVTVLFKASNSKRRCSRYPEHCLIFREATSCAAFVVKRAEECRNDMTARIDAFRNEAVKQGWLN